MCIVFNLVYIYLAFYFSVHIGIQYAFYLVFYCERQTADKLEFLTLFVKSGFWYVNFILDLQLTLAEHGLYFIFSTWLLP